MGRLPPLQPGYRVIVAIRNSRHSEMTKFIDEPETGLTVALQA
jgi:hypothetical protein